MTGRIGRQVRFFFGGNSPGDEILGVREKGVELNGAPVDVTSDEDSGVRTLLADLAQEDQITISLSGVSKDTRVKEAWFNGNRTQPCTLVYPDGSQLQGTYFLSDFKETEPFKDASTFTATLMNSGPVTYTPAP